MPTATCDQSVIITLPGKGIVPSLSTQSDSCIAQWKQLKLTKVSRGIYNWPLGTHYAKDLLIIAKAKVSEGKKIKNNSTHPLLVP